VNDADQDIAEGDAEEGGEGHRKWRQGECAAAAAAAVRGAGRSGRLRTAAPGRGGGKVWEYIKSNNLQNPENRREILADDKLKEVFGKDKVTMFEMNKHLARHLT
jgi:upstream activation factor subunit UAF30